jgi:mediator of RNA polymerase II transcription subunit 10
MMGKEAAFRSFRDVLAREMDSALPELREDVKVVLEATGGVSRGGREEENGGGGGGGEDVEMKDVKVEGA